MVGAYLPQPLAQRLRLDSLHQEITVTKALEDALKYAFKHDTTGKQLIETLGSKFFREWQSQIIKEQACTTKAQIAANFKIFEHNLSTKLEQASLTQENISAIISVLKEEYEASKPKISAK